MAAAVDSDSDDGLLLEENAPSGDDEEELLLEENDAFGSDAGDDDFDLVLETNGDGEDAEQEDDDDQLLLEDNADQQVVVEAIANAEEAPPPPREAAPAADTADGAQAHSALEGPRLSAGQCVRITGLRSRPELNERVGCIAADAAHLQRPQTGATRVGVLVDGLSAPLSLKPDNLLAIPRAELREAVPWWRAAPDEQHAAAQTLAADLADATLDAYAPPPGALTTDELRSLHEAARQRVDNIMRAHGDPEGQMVAAEMGLLDDKDRRLSATDARARLWRKFYYKELGGALFRARRPDDAHRCCCAASRSCDTYRELYAHWVSRLLEHGRRAMADAVARLGERRGAFDFAAQRPVANFVRGLTIRGHPGPWYEPQHVAAARVLLDAYPAILDEYRGLLRATEAAAAAGASSSSKESGGGGGGGGGGFERYPSPAIARGEWSDYMLIHGGRRDARHCAACPRLAELLCRPGGPLRHDAGAMVVGSAFFSRMRPGTHLRAHCGPNNLRLRIHIGVDVPGEGAWKLRVGDEVREWRQGEALVFDDSFEHEVWHEPGAARGGAGRGPLAAGGAPPADADAPSRVVLIVDVWHPAIPPHQRRGLIGGERETARYDAITKTDAPLETMTERELSDGSVRRVAAAMNGH